MTEFDAQYSNILNRCLKDGIEQYTDRVKMKTRALLGVELTLNPKNFPISTLRKIPLKFFIAETIWFLQGTPNLDFFQKFSKGWDNFKDANNCVESNYGYRWRRYFGRDQIESLLEMLAKEPSSRQGVIMTWDAASDGLASPKKPSGVPCGCMHVFNVLNGKLFCHAVYRSEDLILGTAHDVPGTALLQHIIAQKMNLGLGELHFSFSNAQVYEVNYENARELSERKNDHQEIQLTLPPNSFDRAVKGDEALVEEIYQSIRPQYNPLSSLGDIPIAA
jgi:thymidylate synthase